MIKNRDIVVVGLQPWDIAIGSNCKNIAMELSKFNRVLYVNPPLDGITRYKRRHEPAVVKRLEIIKSKKPLVRVSDNIQNLFPRQVILSINWIPVPWLFNLLNRKNNRRFARDISDAIDELGFTDFILFNDSDMVRSFHLIELLNPSLSIYYSRDNLMAVPYFYKHGHTLEPMLMQKSTLICTNSPYLATLARKHNPRTYYVGQGCDLSLFNLPTAVAPPADLAEIPGPIIGYIGAIISYRLDLQLLEELCNRKPEWSFVFIGKEDEAFRQSRLHDFRNVYFLGLKKEEQLPGYLAHFDVAMNPQSNNAMTIGNYPRKVDEYLAMGKPVVATATETMAIFGDHVYSGKTANDYIDLIGKALVENDPGLSEKRKAFARTHTWEKCVEAICDAVQEANAVDPLTLHAAPTPAT